MGRIEECRVQDRWISVCRGCVGVYGLRKMSMVDIACLYFYACAATLYFDVEIGYGVEFGVIW